MLYSIGTDESVLFALTVCYIPNIITPTSGQIATTEKIEMSITNLSYFVHPAIINCILCEAIRIETIVSNI